MSRNPINDFGKQVKIALINKGETQNWLIDQVKEKTGLYFDDSYLNKIMTGQKSPAKIVSAISEILGIADEQNCKN